MGVFSTSWIITFLYILVCYICKTKTIYLNSSKNLSNVISSYVFTYTRTFITLFKSKGDYWLTWVAGVQEFAVSISGFTNLFHTGPGSFVVQEAVRTPWRFTASWGKIKRNFEWKTTCKIFYVISIWFMNLFIFCLYLKFFKIFRK